MSLTDKKYSAIHNKTGSDKDLLKDEFDKGHINMIADSPEDDGVLTALVYQVQLMQDELDYLRTEISTNKGKATFPGFGTSNSTALVGDTKLISIGANTTVSFGDMVVGRSSTITITAVHTDPSSGKVTTATHKLQLA
jgi:hypothetical protein